MVFTSVLIGFWAWTNFTKFDKIRRVLVLRSLALAEKLLNCHEKASFVLILTKPVEPIFKMLGHLGVPVKKYCLSTKNWTYFFEELHIYETAPWAVKYLWNMHYFDLVPKKNGHKTMSICHCKTTFSNIISLISIYFIPLYCCLNKL